MPIVNLMRTPITMDAVHFLHSRHRSSEFASNSHTSRTKFFPPFNSYTPAWKAKKFPDHCSPALKEK
jgi:hypothetical protein